MADLFAPEPSAALPADAAPLAERLRPASLNEVIGQEHLTGPEGAIGRMVKAGRLSMSVARRTSRLDASRSGSDLSQWQTTGSFPVLLKEYSF